MRHLKEEFDKLSFKELIIYSIAIGTQVAGIVAIFVGMLLPPRGEVHASLLTYFGISCTFTGSLLGISYHYSNELNKFKTAITQQLAKVK